LLKPYQAKACGSAQSFVEIDFDDRIVEKSKSKVIHLIDKASFGQLPAM
jgi:hypothetical protein|tara:strand:- start:373 stop:519 length:147 start_codon:yes stop_codon:yes gene_type:complete